MEQIQKKHLKCRCCGSDKMTKYLDLGMMPLANNLELTQQKAIHAGRYPLEVMLCVNCGLSQLSVVIDPTVLFSYYTYRSGVNQGYIDHCGQMAEDLAKEYELSQDSFHIDIAGNDGTLLDVFRSKLNHKVLNVDPAENLTAIAREKGIYSIADFWGKDIVNRYSLDCEVDLITATNVFAHLDDVCGFLEACNLALKNTGVLVIENPYIRDFIYKNEFDQVYFEHVSYWSLTPMVHLAKSVGLRLIDCEWMDIHGGTMRYVLAKTNSAYNSKKSVSDNLYSENLSKYHLPEIYHDWANSVYRVAKNLKRNLSNLKSNGFKIAGFAASAKGNTLLNFAGIDHSMIDFIVDQTPEKIGKFSPGTGIPIVGIEEVKKQNPDYIIILSWNFKDEIMEKLKPIFKGKFIIPMPDFEVI
jgi:hypothetical protein